MLKTVNIHQAKTHLSRLIEAAVAGEDIVIARAGTPLVRLVPVTSAQTPRALGALAGKVTEREDAWAADPELEKAFYGGEVEPAHARRVADRARKTAGTRRHKKK